VFRAAAIVALVASGLIALSSCSSGQPASTAANTTSTTARPASSPPGSSPAPAASATSTAAAANVSTSSVRIRFLTEVFATPLPSDPAKAKVIEGFRESQILWDQSTEELRIVPSATEYITGKALVNLRDAVTSGAKDGVALGGTDRLYDTTVSWLTSKSASVTSCDDGSKTSSVDLATRQKIPNDPNAPQTVLVIWQMSPVGGHWAITSLEVITPPDPRFNVCLTQ